MASRRRTLQVVLSLLALILLGTVVVLSTISFYLKIDTAAYLTEEEVGASENDWTWNATDEGKVERIPRILHLKIDTAAYLTEEEVGASENDWTWNATDEGKVERIPRILHQTWKTETLPDRWKDISQECRDMMPD